MSVAEYVAAAQAGDSAWAAHGFGPAPGAQSAPYIKDWHLAADRPDYQVRPRRLAAAMQHDLSHVCSHEAGHMR